MLASCKSCIHAPYINYEFEYAAQLAVRLSYIKHYKVHRAIYLRIVVRKWFIIKTVTFSFHALIKQRWLHLLNLPAKDDCIFLTREFPLAFCFIINTNYACFI